MRPVRAAASVVAAAAVPVVLALRFAVLYRERAGFPSRVPPAETPDAFGLAWDAIAVPTSDGTLPGWFVPAPGPGPAPCVVLVHGWSSNRARMLPFAAFLHAAGFHTLSFDVRGHGENPAELLPISAAEFGADAAAAVDAASTRSGISSIGILGHSMGGAGAAIAAASRSRVDALVMTAAPADPRLLVRETFRMAGLRIPSPIAQPLAWVTARLYGRPRGVAIGDASARRALARYRGRALLAQGDADELVPLRDLRILERTALRRSVPGARAEVLVVPGGAHRWLYEAESYRRAVSAFFATSLAGSRDAALAADAAAAVRVTRPADTEGPLLPARAVRGRATQAA
jgi:uncharacterized protein